MSDRILRVIPGPPRTTWRPPYRLTSPPRRASAPEGQPIPSTAPSFRLSAEESVLRAPLAPAVDVVVWERKLPTELSAAISRWALDATMQGFDQVIEADHPPISEMIGALPLSLQAPLGADLARLVSCFRALTGSSRLRVGFELQTHDQCPKFHVDAVEMRLITAYIGPGTEWLSEDAVDREALQKHDYSSFEEANAAILRPGARVRHAQAGEVLILRGSRSLTAQGRGAVHRSPPIESSQARRLLLILTAGGRS